MATPQQSNLQFRCRRATVNFIYSFGLKGQGDDDPDTQEKRADGSAQDKDSRCNEERTDKAHAVASSSNSILPDAGLKDAQTTTCGQRQSQRNTPSTDDKSNQRYVINDEDIEAILGNLKNDPRRRLGGGTGVPNCRKGLMPHIDFPAKDIGYVMLNCAEIIHAAEKDPEGAQKNYHKEVGTTDDDNVFKPLEVTFENLVLKVNGIIRLFPTASTCLISIEACRCNTDEDLNANDILKILNLVKSRQRDRNTPQLTAKGGKFRIYDLFYRSLIALTSNQKIYLLEKCDETGNIFPIEQDNKPEERQNPWVVTVAEVEGDVARAFCEPTQFSSRDSLGAKLEEIMGYNGEIAPLLFRAPGTTVDALKLEPAYLDPPFPGGVPSLFSMALDARIFIQASRRSILCICTKKDVDPAKFIVPDVLKLSELVRARWHTLIMMNKVLDTNLRNLRNKAKNGNFDVPAQVRKLSLLRHWLSTSLEDPGIYVISGDALAKIYEHLVRTFRIDELRELVIGKMTLSANIFRDIQEELWLMERPSPKRARDTSVSA